MKPQDYYLIEEIDTKKYKVWSKTLPRTRMLVPYEIIEGLGLLSEFKEPSAIFNYVMNGYDVALKGEAPVTTYRSLFDIKKYSHLYIKDTEEGYNGFATEDDLYNIYSIYDMEIDHKECPIVGYTFSYPWKSEDEKEQYPAFEDYNGYELVYDVRNDPTYKEFVKIGGFVVMRKYSKKEVLQSGKEFSDRKRTATIEVEPHFYVPEYICTEFGILDDYDGPDIFHIEPIGNKFYGLYNVNGKIPYYDYEEAKELGIFIGADAEELVGWHNHHNYSIIGYTFRYPVEEYEDETTIDMIVHLVYNISQTPEFQSYSLKKHFLPKEQLI